MIRAYEGRVAVVTGAANGLGLAITQELAARNCNLALLDIDAPALAAVHQSISRPGIAVSTHVADVASEPSWHSAASQIAQTHGSVHLLIHCAGLSASAEFLNTSAAEFDRIVRVNFFGIVHGCRVLLPLVRESGGGQILNVASCFSWQGYPRKTAYASSKGAVRAFSESLRGELAGAGVGVTVLYPGPLHTNLVHCGFSDSRDSLDREEQFLRKRGLPLDVVARRSLDRLLANPVRIVIGTDYRILDLVSRLSPGLSSRLAAIASRRNGF